MVDQVERVAHILSEHGGAADWGHALELAGWVIEEDPARAALRRMMMLSRQIMIDVGARHSSRLRTADHLTIEQDADFRRELQEAFDEARAVLFPHPNNTGEV